MPRPTQRVLAVVAAAAVATALVGCGSSSGSRGKQAQLTVFAASSLQDPFTTLASTFEKDHRDVKVVLNFGPSSGLAEQIGQGAPADVFAAASTKTMGQVGDQAPNPTDFATNKMEIAVPPANPGRITQLSDLARPGVKLAVCQADVPCGTVATEVFTHAQLTVRPVTEEADVKSVLTKVELGEVDAGIVYVTDVKAAGAKVKGIEIPDDVNATTTYPIAALQDAKQPSLAAAFVKLVESSQGQQVLSDAGFLQP